MIVRSGAFVLLATCLAAGPAFAATAAPAGASKASHVAVSSQAPADEYFGKLRMSAIGVRMRIDVLGRRYTARTESDDDLLHDAGDVETALKAWIARYPNDTWAAPTAYHLAQLYQEVQTAEARSRARAAFTYVESTYPNSKFGHFARLRLAQGFPALHDESPVVASPSPGGSPASGASSPLPSSPATAPAPAAPPAPPASAASPAAPSAPTPKPS